MRCLQAAVAGEGFPGAAQVALRPVLPVAVDTPALG